MSETEIETTDAFPEDLAEPLVENSTEIMANRDSIERVFENIIKTDKVFNNMEKLSGGLELALTPQVDQDEIGPLINGLISTIVNFDPDYRSEFEEYGADEELVSFISDLKLRYGVELTQRLNREWKGRDWWSNIKTNVGVRSNRVYFRNELTIDFEREVDFNSGPESTLVLVDHFLRQITAAKNTIGEDILDSIRKEQVEEIHDHVSDLLEEIDEYQAEDKVESGSEEDSKQVQADPEETE